MTTMLRPAATRDGDALRRLLSAAALPDALEETWFPDRTAVVTDREQIVGAAALEIVGRAALLRSVVVDPAFRHRGIASNLVADRIAAARDAGCTDMFLLTTTAASYFARSGFAPSPRSAVPAGLNATREFAMLCPASALCMHRAIA